MSADDLIKPLGVKSTKAVAPVRKLPVGRILGGVVGLGMAALGGYIGFVRDPLGGEPMTTASIEKMPTRITTAGDTPATQNAETSQQGNQQTASNIREVPAEAQRANTRSTAGELESDAGVKVIRRNGEAPGAVVIRVPDAPSATRLAPAPDRRLVERGKHGNLPKLAPDGSRPADVYARPVTAQQRQAGARIAIVIGGLGIGQNTTNEAIKKLPGQVSLAFAPYGNDLDRTVSRAREDGHEVLLQAPMEPFDYPDNDPGPHTLVATGSPDQNIDKLHWMMSRFNGYVGIVNFMGGRFTSNDQALTPLMRELNTRGLLFLDDGSSGRSVASQVASGAGVSSGRADVVIDAVQRGADIDAALARLEKIAKEKGSAVGYGSALNVTVDRLAQWAKGAEARGITLVPISALVTSAKRS
jgi:uncharacterized protein